MMNGSEPELTGLDALDEGRPLLLGERQHRTIGILRVAHQVNVVDLGHLDAGAATATLALPPLGHVDLVHLSCLRSISRSPAHAEEDSVVNQPRRTGWRRTGVPMRTRPSRNLRERTDALHGKGWSTTRRRAHVSERRMARQNGSL